MVLHLTRPLLSCKGILLNVGENFSHQGIFTTEPQSSQRLSIFFSLCPPCLRGEYSKISSNWSELGVPFDFAQDNALRLCASHSFANFVAFALKETGLLSNLRLMSR